MTPQERSIDTGDTVFHRPSGETWTVACVEDGRLYWMGWPQGCARLDDCDLIEKATEAEREEDIRRWAESDPSDFRCRHARRRLSEEVAARTGKPH